MIRYECDKCGRRLSPSGSDRYILRMELFAAGAPLSVSEAELSHDRSEELQDLIEQLRDANPDQVEDQTYRCLRFDLCAACHRAVLMNPLGD